MAGTAEKVVCVTGASGYIAFWLVKLLLQNGYTVNATVRDPNDPKKTEHLLALDGANERLHLFKAELDDEGSLDSAVRGCIGVFHTAHPVCGAPNDPEDAVNGTLNVLQSCTKVPSIKRVILTSSMVAAVYTGKPLTDDDVVDETWFSDPVVLENSKSWYALSKILAEKAAWKFSEENGIDMVTINPDFVLGPLLQPIRNICVILVTNLIGAETFPNSTYRYVDVRDVAKAHILAFENPSAHGRYCVTGKPSHCSEISRIIQELYPDFKLPKKCAYDDHFIGFLPAFKVSQEKVKSLGLNLIPLEVCLKDTVDSIMEKKLLSV